MKKISKSKSLLLVLCMLLTMTVFCGCGNDTDNNNNSSEQGIIGGAADAVEDVADGVADGIKDVADGVGNTVKGMFSSFDDAQDWFMNKIPDDINTNGRFQIANSDKDLTSFSGGRTGYHFELHDNNRDGNTKVGDFYIDSENGKIYKSDEHGKTFAEYDFSDLK